MKQIIMLGAGGFAREVMDTIDTINAQTGADISAIGFVYDGGDKNKGKLIQGLPVLGDISRLKEFDLNKVKLVAAVGRSVWRRTMVEKAKKLGGKFMSIIHPTVTISKWAKIGEGAIMQRLCVVMPGVVIGDFFIGNGLLVIGPDAVVGDYVHANTYTFIAERSVIGNDVFIGVNATILPIKIGENAVIGASALLTKDVPPNMIAKGMPAKFYEMNEKKY
jgi:acetyltransferase EpsM